MLYSLSDVQDMGKNHLSDGGSAVGGDIGYGNATLFGCGNIDDVISGGYYANILQVGQGCHVFCRDHHLVGKNRFCILRAFKYLVGSRAVIDFTLTQSSQFVPVQISGVGGITV